MAITNGVICPKCAEANSPLAANCVMCHAALPVRPKPAAAPVLKAQEDFRPPPEEVESDIRPAAIVLQIVGIGLAVLSARVGIGSLLFPHQDAAGFTVYGSRGGFSGVFLGLGLWRVGASNMDWTEIGLDLQGKTQWGPIIMTPGVLGMCLGVVTWFPMNDHSTWVALVLIFSTLFLVGGGVVYARELMAGNGEPKN